MNKMEVSMHACRRGKTEYINGIICFNSVSSTAYVSQFPSYGGRSIKGKSQTDGLQINPACVACLAVCAKHELEK